MLVWALELLQAGSTDVKYRCLFFRATPSSVGLLRITSSPPSMAHWTLLDCSLGSDSTLICTVFSSTGRKGTEVVVPGPHWFPLGQSQVTRTTFKNSRSTCNSMRRVSRCDWANYFPKRMPSSLRACQLCIAAYGLNIAVNLLTTSLLLPTLLTFALQKLSTDVVARASEVFARKKLLLSSLEKVVSHRSSR